MHNVWGFLLCTLSASVTALVLLAVKAVLNDKLSPRWQYGVWSVLALRLILPVSMSRTFIIPLPLWLETAKTLAEKRLSSVYSAAYIPITSSVSLLEKPESLTDWLFVIYFAGVAVTLLHYIISYIRLRLLLKKGNDLSDKNKETLETVCNKYNLTPCRAVEVEGLSSAFICGVIHPVLALPADRETDEKIMLHELLHKKRFDALQNIFWSVLKAFHWCNPFLRYCFARISNDTESLCDQRVLELLEGEERREYGSILLNMANEKYARAVGTTSVSNGGKNISRRIASIVRFKKYPRGMALVSVCIVIVLAVTAVIGTAIPFAADAYAVTGGLKTEKSLAMTRITRCTTVAGALDTYAKALILKNNIYLAAVSPLEKQEELARNVNDSVYCDKDETLADIDAGKGYTVHNLTENDDGSYKAVLSFSVRRYDEETKEMTNDCVLVFLLIFNENGWVVEETEERRVLENRYNDLITWEDNDLPVIKTLNAKGDYGEVTIDMRTYHVIERPEKSGGLFLYLDSSSEFTNQPNLNAKFGHSEVCSVIQWKYGENLPTPQRTLMIQSKPVDSADEAVDFSALPTDGGSSGTDNSGLRWQSTKIHEDWDKTVQSRDYLYNGSGELPSMYRLRLLHDGELVEELTVGECEK